jgi:hypothetical protein
MPLRKMRTCCRWHSAAIRVQLDQAGDALEALYANFPSPLRRVVGAMVLNRSTRLAPLRDVQLLELAKLLRTNPAVVKRLCPDLATPSSGGLRDLMDALDLATQLGKKPWRSTRPCAATSRWSAPRKPQAGLSWRWLTCAPPTR